MNRSRVTTRKSSAKIGRILRHRLTYITCFALISSNCATANEVHIDVFEGTDIERLTLAIEAAGVGGTVLFGSGKTYEFPRFVTLDSQTWKPDGTEPATIKRAPPAKTVLTSDVVAGDRTIQVADSSVFQVGTEISPLLPGGNGGLHDGVSRLTRIIDITGNQLTVDRDLSAFPLGAAVITSGRLVVMSGASPRLERMTIDGNRMGNHHWVNWAIHYDVHTLYRTHDAAIEQVVFVGAPGNAISDHAANTHVTDSIITDANCAAVHLSSSRDFVFRNVVVRDTNEKAALCDHSTGAIEWSLYSTNVTIEDSIFESIDAWALGINSVDQTGTNGIYVRNSSFIDNAGVFQVTKRNDATVDKHVAMVFEDNLMVNSGEMLIWSAGDVSIKDIGIVGNRFIETSARITGPAESMIANNVYTPSDVFDVSNVHETTVVNGNQAAVPGDANVDLVLDAADLNALALNWLRTSDQCASRCNWTHGDFDNDQTIGLRDMHLFALNWQGWQETQRPITTIPEPSGRFGLGVALFVIIYSTMPKRIIAGSTQS